jgi:hypothetical protein
VELRYFWHPIIRKSFSSTSSWILVDGLGVDPQGAVHRQGVIVLVFLMSCLMHQASELHWVNPKAARATFWWWNLQAPAMFIEEHFIRLYLRHKPEIERHIGIRMPYAVERAIGYLWVFLFLWWSVPRLEYGKVRAVYGMEP